MVYGVDVSSRHSAAANDVVDDDDDDSQATRASANDQTTLCSVLGL